MKITSVWIERAEGPAALCVERTFTNLADAEAWLRQNAITAPSTGGYDKHDFMVTFSDGQTYDGRIDLQRQHTAGYSIAQHIEDFLTFLAGTRRPAHLSPERYAEYLKHHANEAESAKEFLAKYLPALKGVGSSGQEDFLAWVGE